MNSQHPNSNPAIKKGLHDKKMKHLDEKYGILPEERPEQIASQDWGRMSDKARRIACRTVFKALKGAKKDEEVKVKYLKGLKKLFIPEQARFSVNLKPLVGWRIFAPKEADQVFTTLTRRDRKDKQTEKGRPEEFLPPTVL